jgi:lincosamide nucleotidyltransferase A/C/D/E
VLAADVLRILDALDRAGARYWISGGWGVDALAGETTRGHRDLDLAIDVRSLPAVVDALDALGFAPETDWLPVRLEMTGGPGGWVDLHPVRFTADGTGVQQGLDGTEFTYPAPDLITGRIDGRRVPCISIALQLAFHEGYPVQPKDLHDLGVLGRLHNATSADGPGWPRSDDEVLKAPDAVRAERAEQLDHVLRNDRNRE